MTSNEKKATLLSLLSNWENEVVEFKSGGKGFSSDEIGKYFSALSNEANLRGLEAAWRVVMFEIPPAPRGIPIAWKGHYYARSRGVNNFEAGSLRPTSHYLLTPESCYVFCAY